MANAAKIISDKRLSGLRIPRLHDFKIPLATKLMLGFLLIIVFISAVFWFVGVRLISNRIVAEAQEKVRNDLNAAREIYLSELTHINDIVRITARRFFLREALLSNDLELAFAELQRIKEEEGLDVLAITDKYGYVLLRTSNPEQVGDNQGHDELLHSVLLREVPIASTTIVSAENLNLESPLLAEQAYFKFIDTPLARDREELRRNNGHDVESGRPDLR